MGVISEFKRATYSGAVADMADVVNPAIGDKFFATDTFKSFFYTGAEWIRGLLEAMIDHTWEGDNANNREIDLGDDYDFILIWNEESKGANVSHGILAHAFRNCYGGFYENGATVLCRHSSMAATDGSFQGKMTGGDSTKIKLGSTGNIDEGFNFLNWTYRLIGSKFQDMT